MENINSNQSVAVQTENLKDKLIHFWQKLPLMNKLLIGLMLMLFFLIFLLILFQPRTGQQSKLKSSPVLLATPSDLTSAKPVSKFAQTDTFKEFEKKISALQAESETTDLSETRLTFPLLDMQVTFK